jgi:hypothetical protein
VHYIIKDKQRQNVICYTIINLNIISRLRLKVETLEIRKDKIDELQQTIDSVKSKLGLD